eukprot:761964-Hanusia_phi.AAC.4
MAEPLGVSEEEAGRGLRALRALLSPPPVPDGAWYAATASMVMNEARTQPHRYLSDPANHPPCKMLIAGLQSGLFRTQSSLLDCLSSLLDVSELNAIEIIAADPAMPLAHAALALCEEQRDRGGTVQQTLPGLRREDRQRKEDGEGREDFGEGEGEGEESEDAVGQEDERGKGTGRIATGAEDLQGAQRLVNQMCCENPMDCEEPAVREAGERRRREGEGAFHSPDELPFSEPASFVQHLLLHRNGQTPYPRAAGSFLPRPHPVFLFLLLLDLLLLLLLLLLFLRLSHDP